MGARERLAWVHLVTMVVAMGAYALAVSWWHAGLGPLARIGLLAVPLGGMGLVSLGAWVMGRGEVPDERDRAVDLHATRVAYQVLLAGFLYVGFVLPFTQGGWDIVHAALAAVVLAELVHSGLVVRGYRKRSGQGGA